MDSKTINQKAIESLKKYFNSNPEITKIEMDPLSKEEVTKIVDEKIADYKTKINELNELKLKINNVAEESFTKIFGQAKVEPKKNRLSTDEMEQQLNKQTAYNLKMMNELKQQRLAK